MKVSGVDCLSELNNPLEQLWAVGSKEPGGVQIPCRPATHFCSMCRKGLVSRRNLRLHKKRCRNNKIQKLRKIVNEFFEHLSGDFTHKLHELEKIFIQDSNTNEPENTYTTLLQSTAFGSVISK